MKRLLLLAAAGLFALPAATLDFNDPSALARAAVDLHPALARIRVESDAARERIAPAGALPDPMLMGGIQNKMIDFKDDEMMTIYMAGAVIAAARVRYEVGTAAQADVIRAQLQRAGLDQEILRLRGTRGAAVARLVPLLGLPSVTNVPPLRMPEGTADLPVDARTFLSGINAGDRVVVEGGFLLDSEAQLRRTEAEGRGPRGEGRGPRGGTRPARATTPSSRAKRGTP